MNYLQVNIIPPHVIPKKQGCYRLLQDLCVVNGLMEEMGSAQPGLPHPSAVPSSYYVLVLDIKDCFFQIPLVPQDPDNFAFTVWEPNMHKPAKRYQYTVLPQGMKNSPTICQLYISQALINVPRDVLLIQYTDDLLLAHPDAAFLQKTAKGVLEDLALLYLMVAPDKVQIVPRFAFRIFYC